MPRFLRLLLLAAFSGSLTSCGTASHYLGMAGGLINSITSPVLGAIRLSDDTPPEAAPSSASPSRKRYESPKTPAKRAE